jgi:hypothetical protein
MELLITACQKRERLDLTPGKQMLDLTSVDDISGFITSNIGLSGFFDNKILSISGTIIKLRDLGKTIEREFKTEGLLNWGRKPYRENEVMKPPFYYKKTRLSPNSLEKYIKDVAHGEF